MKKYYKQKEKYILDFSNINSAEDMHKIIKCEFNFPDYYGMNWDAFWDCMTDMVGTRLDIEVIGLDKIYSKFAKSVDILIDSLRDLKHIYNDKYSNLIKIVIHHGQSSVEI